MEYFEEIIVEGFCCMHGPFGWWNSWTMFLIGGILTIIFTVLAIVGIILFLKWLSTLNRQQNYPNMMPPNQQHVGSSNTHSR